MPVTACHVLSAFFEAIEEPRLDPARARRHRSAPQLRDVHGHGTLNFRTRRLAPLDRRSWERGADEQARTRLARRGRDTDDQG